LLQTSCANIMIHILHQTQHRKVRVLIGPVGDRQMLWLKIAKITFYINFMFYKCFAVIADLFNAIFFSISENKYYSTIDLAGPTYSSSRLTTVE